MWHTVKKKTTGTPVAKFNVLLLYHFDKLQRVYLNFLEVLYFFHNILFTLLLGRFDAMRVCPHNSYTISEQLLNTFYVS